MQSKIAKGIFPTQIVGPFFQTMLEHKQWILKFETTQSHTYVKKGCECQE